MKKRICCLFLVAVMVMLLGACGNSGNKTNSKVADMVVYGNIYTVDDNNSSVQAMAVKNGKIVYTGTKSGAKEYIGDNTEVKDYKQQFIIPGFIDGHVHIYVDAENQAGFLLSDCKNQTQKDYLALIKKYIKAHPDMKIYKGFGWLDSAFIGGSPTTEMLDKICSDKPIYIKSEDCHSCWVNSKMLEMTGVTSKTKNPVGGVIEHYKNGKPNGCFRDTAMDYLVKPHVPSYSTKEYESMLLKAQAKMESYGYTAYNDVIIDPQSATNICEAYHNLDKAGKLTATINASILVNNTKDYVDKLNEAVKLSKKYSGTDFKITDIKIFMDGIVESETAYVSEPYKDGKTGADRWPTKTDVKRLYDLTKRINDAGLVAHFHAIGDAAIEKSLDALEYAQTNSKNKNIRNVITHTQMITKKQIKRMADLKVIAAANLGWAPSQNEKVTGSRNIEELNVGKTRNNAMYPFKTMINSGMTVSYATDYPAGPVLKSLYTLMAGVTRQIGKYESTCRNKNERITVAQAITCMTKNGAYQLNKEKELGTLEVGKKANFTILSQDITKIDPTEILQENGKSTTINYTYADGKLVYDKTKSTK